MSDPADSPPNPISCCLAAIAYLISRIFGIATILILTEIAFQLTQNTTIRIVISIIAIIFLISHIKGDI